MLKDIITFYPYQRSFRYYLRGLKRGEFLRINWANSLISMTVNSTRWYGWGRDQSTGRDAAKTREDLARELEHKLKQLGNLLEPVLIMGVGGLVAIVLISMYLPMFRLGGVIG